MRIAYVSTYPPIECGIGTYTQYLSDAVKVLDKEVIILSQFGGRGEKVFPVYNPKGNDIASSIFDVAARLTPDVVHIQHEYGLFGNQRGIQVIELILRCKLAGLPVVTTLHTVYESLHEQEEILLGSIMRESSHIIVHEEYQKETLLKSFPSLAEKITVIPHGVRQCERVQNAKEILEIGNRKVVLLCGYFRESKRFDLAVDLFPRIVEQVGDALLLIAGKLRGLEFSDYQTRFFEKINNSPVADRIMALRGQFPQHTFDVILSAGDVMMMPYEAGAQSGILAQAAAFRVPVVTSTLPSFKLWARKSKGGLTADREDGYITHVTKILKDEEYAQTLKANIASYVKSIEWPEIARRHFVVYEKIIRVPYGKAKYFYIPEPKDNN